MSRELTNGKFQLNGGNIINSVNDITVTVVSISVGRVH